MQTSTYFEMTFAAVFMRSVQEVDLREVTV